MTKIRKPATLAWALLTGAALCAFAAHEAAIDIASSRAADVLAQTSGTSAQSVRINPWTGRIAIDGLVAQTASGPVTIGHIEFSAPQISLLPQFIAPAFALDGSAVAENVTIDGGYMKYTAKRIEAAGTSLSSGDLMDMISTTSQATAVERLERLTAASITIPEITGEGTIGEARQRISYRDVRFVDIVKGKIGAMSSSGGTMNSSDPRSVSMSGAYSTITGKNIDLAGIARFFTVARTDDNEPLKVLYENMTIDNYVIKIDSDIEISMGAMSIRDIKARQTKKPLMAMLPQLADKKALDNLSPEEGLKFGEFALDLFRSMDFGAMEVRDILVKPPVKEDVKIFKIGRFALNGFGQGRLGEYVFENMQIDAKDGNAKIGQFALRGLKFNAVLDEVAAALAKGPKGMDALDPKKLIPSLDQIVFSGLDLDVPDKKKEGNAANGTRIKFSLGKIEYTGANFLNGIPTTAGLGLDHLVMDIGGMKDPQLKDLIAMGYKSLDMSSHIELAWNEAAQTLGVKQMNADIGGMGSLGIKGTFGNVTKDLFSLDEGLTQAAVLGAVIKDVDLRIANTGLFEKALADQARQQKKSVDQVRKDFISAASIGIPAMLDNSPAAKIIANAVAKFVAQPKNLRITAKSPEGLGASDLALLGNPGDLLKKLDISAAANE